MTTIPRYQLELKSKKHICPRCGQKRFVRFVDNKTNNYIDERFGRCDREQSCQYFLSPYHDKELQELAMQVQTPIKVERKPTSYIKESDFQSTLRAYERNNFAKFLYNTFGEVDAMKAIKKYCLGTSKKFEGATIFWQIDLEQRIRTGKIMLYDEQTGRRKKDGKYYSWIHKQYKDFNLEQCFFGEHLVRGHEKVSVVESEKTALIASIVYPNSVWIATGGLSNVNYYKLKTIKDKRLILYPDLGAESQWQAKFTELQANFKIHSGVRKLANDEDIANGLDIADFILRLKKG